MILGQSDNVYISKGLSQAQTRIYHQERSGRTGESHRPESEEEQPNQAPDQEANQRLFPRRGQGPQQQPGGDTTGTKGDNANQRQGQSAGRKGQEHTAHDRSRSVRGAGIETQDARANRCHQDDPEAMSAPTQKPNQQPQTKSWC